MSTRVTKDGTEIFYRGFGTGQPVLFSHGWPLSGDAWDGQTMFLGKRGYRVLAHDRRSHGRSAQTWDGNNMDQYADDLAELIEKLDLTNLVLIGHSTAGGEVTCVVASQRPLRQRSRDGEFIAVQRRPPSAQLPPSSLALSSGTEPSLAASLAGRSLASSSAGSVRGLVRPAATHAPALSHTVHCGPWHVGAAQT